MEELGGAREDKDMREREGDREVRRDQQYNYSNNRLR
jgi:hypothetical protein